MQIDLLGSFYNQVIVSCLVFVRVFAMFFFSPIFGSKSVPVKMQLIMTVLLTFVIYPIVAPSIQFFGTLDMLSLSVLVLKQLGVGYCIGFCTTICFTIVRFIGALLGRFMGFREGNMMDPLFKEGISSLGQLQFIMFIIFFFIINGHHFLIKLFVKSFDVVPIGTMVITGNLVEKFVDLGGQMFVISLKYVGPVVAFIMVTNVAFGILGKAIPEMNLLILMLPIKIFVGLIGTIIMFPLFVHLMHQLVKVLYRDLNLILRMM